jgi:hypothetical protein
MTRTIFSLRLFGRMGLTAAAAFGAPLTHFPAGNSIVE